MSQALGNSAPGGPWDCDYAAAGGPVAKLFPISSCLLPGPRLLESDFDWPTTLPTVTSVGAGGVERQVEIIQGAG